MSEIKTGDVVRFVNGRQPIGVIDKVSNGLARVIVRRGPTGRDDQACVIVADDLERYTPSA